MKRLALVAAVAAVSILSAASAWAAADDAAGSAVNQPQADTSALPAKKDAKAVSAVPDSKELGGQIKAHHTGEGDITSDKDGDSKDKK